MRKKTEDGASALKKGLAILSCFSWSKNRRSLTEISRELDIPLSTASRLAKALEETGFLERDQETKLFTPGFSCYQIGRASCRERV